MGLTFRAAARATAQEAESNHCASSSTTRRGDRVAASLSKATRTSTVESRRLLPDIPRVAAVSVNWRSRTEFSNASQSVNCGHLASVSRTISWRRSKERISVSPSTSVITSRHA